MLNFVNWTIPESWRAITRTVYANGRDYTIERGSYTGQKRRQIDALSLTILHPEFRPLSPIPNPGEQSVTTDADIQRYFQDYIINPGIPAGEQYTYGQRIVPQLDQIIEILIKTPMTNQATITVSLPSDLNLDDPPCLRELDWKVVDQNGQLQLSSFWRSWDVFTGLPTNLGGLLLLNEFVAEAAGLMCGPMVAYSSGAHIYDHCWSMVQGVIDNAIVAVRCPYCRHEIRSDTIRQEVRYQCPKCNDWYQLVFENRWTAKKIKEI